MKVMVNGSYRPHEPDYNYDPGRLSEFVAAATALGEALAKNKHRLLLVWSNNNIPSQLGAKEMDLENRLSHPYWETAEYHALMGYLAYAQHAPLEVPKGSVEVWVGGHDSEFPDVLSFPHRDVISGKTHPPRVERSVRAPPLTAFDPNSWIDLAPFVQNGLVHLKLHGSADAAQLRLKMLKDQVPHADAVIVLGGGKATEGMIDLAYDQKKLVVFSPFSERGGLSDVDRAFASKLVTLEAALKSLAGGRNQLEQLAALIPAHLPQLLAGASPGASRLLWIVPVVTLGWLAIVTVELKTQAPELFAYGVGAIVSVPAGLLLLGMSSPGDDVQTGLLKLLSRALSWSEQAYWRRAVMIGLCAFLCALGYFGGHAAMHEFTVACNDASGLNIGSKPAKCEGNEPVYVWKPWRSSEDVAATIRCVFRGKGTELTSRAILRDGRKLECGSPCERSQQWRDNECQLPPAARDDPPRGARLPSPP